MTDSGSWGRTTCASGGEILSGQRIEAGGVTYLTADEWLQRWRDFRGRLPEMTAMPQGR